MTSPGGGSGFEYTDDSVIARVSIDVPSQAITDISSLSQAMAAMRAQLDAVADAQEKWLGFLSEMPKVTQDTNSAIKDQITLLERQNYLQGEAQGGRSGAMAGGGGAGGYSTAAPAGYGAGPWQPGTPGMGTGYPAPMNPGQIAEKAERSIAEDPAMAPNMESARGMAVNPALLGAIGAAVGRKFGTGKKAPGSAAPQPGTGDRDSSAPPDHTQGGAPSTSESQDTPTDPNENDTDDSKNNSLIHQLMNDFKGGKDGRAIRMGGTLLGAAGRRILTGGGKGDGGGQLGGLAGMAKNIITSPAGMTAGALGLGALAFNKSQDLGEKYTQFQQLGSVQGGDAMTGMKYEAQARIMALNPFITTQQARQAMQMALKEGFRGDNYDTVQDFMISNFKDLGISMGQSMDIMKSQVKGLSEGDDMSGSASNLKETLNTMKELSAEGGLSLPERVNQLEEMSRELSAQGFSGDAINRAALATQEGMGDSMALRESAGRITTQTTGSNMLMTLAAQKMGVTGVLPNALPAALERAGMDPDEIRDLAASQVAGYVSGYPDPLNRIGAFQMLMGQYGVELTWPEAEALYEKVSGGGGELPSKKGNRVVERQGKTERGAGKVPTKSSNPADANWNSKHSEYEASDNAAGVSDSFTEAGRNSGNFAPSGRSAAPPPNSAGGSPQYITSQGVVTGEVRITVDQAGRVTAPPVIQITGQQKAANAGYSSAQLNNAGPGDPNYNHSFNSFPQAGGG